MRVLLKLTDNLIATIYRSLLFACLVIFSLFAVYTYTRVSGSDQVYAAESTNLNFQARLYQADGSLVDDGLYNVEFKLFDAVTSSGSSQGSCAGDADCLWTETRTGGNQVRVVNGYFNVNLGSVNAFPSTIQWDQEHWLTLNVGGTGSPTWDGEMTPRIKLTAVPYAFQAAEAKRLVEEQLSGTGTLEWLTLTGNRTISLPNSSGTVLLDSTGFANNGNSFGGAATLGTNDANDLILETGGVEGLRIDQDGDVGIGTLADAVEALEVNGGIKLGNTSNTNAGTLRWTGTDFEGYDGAQWVSLTGGGAVVLNATTSSFTSAIPNLAGTTTAAATGFLAFTSATGVTNAGATGAADFIAPEDGSFRSCLVVGNANRTAGTATLRWRVNGVSVGSGVCVIDGTNVRRSAQTIDSQVVTFSAGDVITVAFDSSGLLPGGSTEYTVYWSVEYGSVVDTFFTQDGNSFGEAANLGTNDNFGLNFETNGNNRLSIAATGESTFSAAVAISSGGLSVIGGIDNNSGGITEAGSITGVGSNITATNGLTISSGGSGNLTLDSASNTLMIADSTIRRDAGGTTTINLFDGSNTTLAITNSDGTATAGLSVEGDVSAASFSGDGSGLTALNASNISTGTLSDGRLSANVALLDANQTFTGAVTFDDGLVLAGSTSTTAGALRWTGTDFEGYDGASWVSLTGGGGGGPSSPAQTSVTKTSNECVNNTGSGGCASTGSTLQDDNQLLFPVGADETWSFRFVVQANSSTAADFQFAVSAPSGSTCVIGVTDSEGSTSASNLGCGVSSGLIEGTGGDEVYEIVGTVTSDTTPGNVILRWAQNTSDASNATVYSGSYLTAYIDGGGLTLLQGGNAFGGTVTIGSTDNAGINFIANNSTALSITSTGDATFTGLANLNGGVVVGNAAGDTFTINSDSVTLNNGLNFDTNTFVIDSANNRIGINDASPDNRLTINAPSTSDLDAQALIYTNGTANKGLVIQATAGQTANLFEAQDENGNAIYAIRSSGRLVLGRSSFTNGSLALTNATNGFTAEFQSSVLTADRTITLPDESGILCLDTNNCDFVEMASGTQQTDGSNNDVISIDKTSATGNLLTLERNGAGVFTVFNSGALELQLDSTSAFSVLNSGGTSLFNIDTTGSIIRIGDSTADGTGALLVLDTKNTSGDPTGIEGASYYNSVLGASRCYENGYWADCATSRVQGDSTLSSPAGTISVSITDTGESLRCTLQAPGVSTGNLVYLRFNGVATGTPYGYNVLRNLTGANNNTSTESSAGANQIALNGTTTVNGSASFTVDIDNFGTSNKSATWTGTRSVSATIPQRFSGSGTYFNTSNSITSVDFVTSTGNFNTGTRAWCSAR